MNVLIEIRTLQKDLSTNQTDTINLVSRATLKSSQYFDIIQYEESELTGLSGNKTVIKIEKDSLTIMRYGKNTSKMYFKQNVKSNRHYSTPYGNFDLEIETKNLKITKDNNKNIYEINVQYNINIKKLFKGFNMIDIIVKK